MIPVPGWREEYSMLVEDVLQRYELEPTRITLGTLRGLWKTVKFAKDRSWYAYLRGGEKTGWGLKIKPDLREEMYRHVLSELRGLGYSGDVALCKETPEMWRRLSDLLPDPGTHPEWSGVRCNCV